MKKCSFWEIFLKFFTRDFTEDARFWTSFWKFFPWQNGNFEYNGGIDWGKWVNFKAHVSPSFPNFFGRGPHDEKRSGFRFSEAFPSKFYLVSLRISPKGNAVFKRPACPVRSEAQLRNWFLPDSVLGFFCACFEPVLSLFCTCILMDLRFGNRKF